MVPYAGYVVAVAAIQAFSSYKAGKAKAREARRLAEARERQAQELLARSEFNVEGITQDAKVFKGSQIAASTFDVGGGNVLMALEDTQRKMQNAISLERRTAQYEANILRAGGQIAMDSANEERKSFLPNLAATGIQAYAQYKSGQRA